ncbi:dethiobiotin synthase [Rosenbergiella nectarea]|uniref:ATP-dependent dethiobiotin synthetase BioD n=1 Tax=Rosenbergiella nectarea TaxID=988801 RepID=A0A1H9G437_9GAMM|nr:dethiobiotin synthase [Rosenbergiella nectarea]SEQ44935.1 dethiobiotin synthase [Rosenbergiella nectarea]
MNKVFITGTDTAVGKTVVSLALLQMLRQQDIVCAGYKPLSQNAQLTEQGLQCVDAQLLQQASTIALDYDRVNPYPFTGSEVSTGAITTVNERQLTTGMSFIEGQVERLVIEGTGGWHSRINTQNPLSDWVIKQKIPVILVVGIKLGCINHAILTAESILQQGGEVVGWVANRINPGLEEYQQLITLLTQHIAAPKIGEIPYIPHAHQKDLAAYFTTQPLANFFTR